MRERPAARGFASRGTAIVAMLIAVAVAVRLGLLLLGWPETNSDEGTMGVMALHIAQGRDWPAFFYGQSYMGSGEAWAAAALFSLFGPSLDGLRLALVAAYAGFLVVAWRLGELLCGRRAALVGVLLLTLGSVELLEGQLRATGSRVELLLTGATIAWLSAWLVLRGPAAEPRRTGAAAAGLGLAAGFGLWTDLLTLSSTLAAAVLLALCWRPARPGLAVGLLLAGVLAGALPQVLYNAHARWGQDDALSVLLRLRAYQAGTVSPPLLDRVVGALTLSLPYASGGGVLTRLGGGTAALAVWAACVLALLAVAAGRGLADLRGAWAGPGRLPAAPLAGLSLLGAVAVTIAIYATSPAASYTPMASSRYLVGLLIAVPVLVGALARWVETGRRRLVAGVAVAAVVGLLAADTIGTYQRALTLRRTDAEQVALVGALLDRGVTRIWTDYWTCDRIVFESRERIVCGSLDPDLSLGYNRYPPYLQAVRADPGAPYLFPADSPQADRMRRQARSSSPLPDGYLLFR